MPVYETKLKDESAWAALLVAVGLFLSALGMALNWNMDVWSPVIVSGLGVTRLVVGLVLPSPTTES